MTIEHLSQFLWGKWLQGDGRNTMFKESGYEIIGSSPNIDAKEFIPGTIIGRPYLNTYDIESYTLTEKNQDLLWSLFYYKVDDKHWEKWTENQNRPYIIEHHVIIPKGIFLRLRFDLDSLRFSSNNPPLDIIYYSKNQILDDLVLTSPDEDFITHMLQGALRFFQSNAPEVPLIVYILNNYSKYKNISITNSDLSPEQRLLILQYVLALLPDKDAVKFTFNTQAYLMANITLFNVVFVSPDIPMSSISSKSVNYTSVTKDTSENDGYGSQLLEMIKTSGIEETAKVLRQTTHNLIDLP